MAGFLARTATSLLRPRTLTAGQNISISNPTGDTGDPTFAFGATFTNVTYNAGNYTATSPAGTWTVDVGDVVTNRYTMLGANLLFWQLELQTTSVAGGPLLLNVLIPNGLTSTAQVSYPIFISDNGAADFGLGQTVGGTLFRCLLKSITAWANSTNNSYVRFSVLIPV